MQKSKPTILLTGGGGAGTIAIIKSLKDKFRIVTTDMNPYGVGMYLAHAGYTVPASNDPGYFRVLEGIIKKERVDVLIPLIDEELLLFSRRYRGEKKLKLVLPREEFIALCLDKWQLGEVLKDHKIPYAKTSLVSSFKTIPKNIFPCIIKPRTGRGSRGFQPLDTRDDLTQYLKTTSLKTDQLIIQERLIGKEYTVSAVVGKDGDILAVVPKEVILKKGITKVGVTRKNDPIVQLAKNVESALHANGPFNMQLIVSSDTGVPTLFEINPRFSTTVALTIAAGVNEIELLVYDALGLPVRKPKLFTKNLVMARYEEQYYFPEAKTKKAYVK
jgi:carbamoyl-phosphate synthase large subunit